MNGSIVQQLIQKLRCPSPKALPSEFPGRFVNLSLSISLYQINLRYYCAVFKNRKKSEVSQKANIVIYLRIAQRRVCASCHLGQVYPFGHPRIERTRSRILRAYRDPILAPPQRQLKTFMAPLWRKKDLPQHSATGIPQRVPTTAQTYFF